MTVNRMEFREDLGTSSDYLRMAVPMMIRRGIPPTPYNYALWYAHVQNANPELSRSLLDEFPDPQSYDPDKSEALFFEYFVKTYLPNSPRARDLIVNIVTQLTKSVSQSVQGTREYGAVLREAMALFEETVDQQRIQEALGGLFSDTLSLENLNRAFQSELESATRQVERLKKELEQSQYSARIDALTKIPNRRAFDDALDQALATVDDPACLMLLDLDNFKLCNDTYGHLMGDRILEVVGRLLAGLMSDSVFVARYGGEEFTVIVNEDLAAASALAESIRHKVSELRIKRKSTQDIIGAVTVSIGLVRARPGDTRDTLIGRADSALYRAKDGGRDRVVVLDDPRDPDGV
ncbi:GGDEF domain-containing protein [Thiocystis violacea]|uniref:GGDEF domain-containing protein n=1 Tax=Thiocystis violacea TaxID=13725 RepID=UPI0019068307|nr:GGDEF domain-containing protein [Thiocystis violacea]MBK1719610.1 GGDEF domain-containing protein [Thiocystis violacea]